MDKRFIHNLQKPCKNRGVKLEHTPDDTVKLDGIEFFTMKDAEDYLESKPRIDIDEEISWGDVESYIESSFLDLAQSIMTKFKGN